MIAVTGSRSVTGQVGTGQVRSHAGADYHGASGLSAPFRLRQWPLAALCLLVLLAGCSSVPPGPGVGARPIAATAAADLGSAEAVREALKVQHAEWAGAPYRWGGMSKSGVDCSGFVWKTFARHFGLDLPRTTAQQVKVGYPVGRGQLAPGDLVFFQTGYSKLHVGIYVDGGRFLHASTSRGVMMSRLDNPYWRDNYWHARRVRE